MLRNVFIVSFSTLMRVGHVDGQPVVQLLHVGALPSMAWFIDPDLSMSSMMSGLRVLAATVFDCTLCATESSCPGSKWDVWQLSAATAAATRAPRILVKPYILRLELPQKLRRWGTPHWV